VLDQTGTARRKWVPVNPFEQLAAEADLLDWRQHSPTGLPERYLYSHDLVYRYAFGRWWGEQDYERSVVWVMLNPATGDTEMRRRPTLQRTITWSKAWGATGVIVLNLFAFRDTDPKGLKDAADPVGPHNDKTLELFTATAMQTVAAWGSKGSLHSRSTTVRPYLRDPLCLGTTSKGEPRHPLYVAADAPVMRLP
jgi:hypothetical protein